MSILSIFLTVVIISLLVVVHEFGHFIVAKKCGILVEEFSVGFGPKLISKQKGETLYSIRCIPLGGYCKMLGEEEDTDDDRAFGNKSVGKRIAVVAAGPIMNFILAMVLLFVLIGTTAFIDPTVEKVSENSGAYTAGIEAGDKIIALNGKSVHLYEDFETVMSSQDGSDIKVTVLRDGKKENFVVSPQFSEESNKWILGVNLKILFGPFTKAYDGYENAGVLYTLKNSFYSTIYYIKATVLGIAQLITGGISLDQVSGPIGIVEVVGESYEYGINYSVGAAVQNMAYLAAILSANLGAMNFLPIPALDGGRLLFFIVELIRRRKMDAETEGKIHFAGFMLLIAFMILVAYNDIIKLIFN